MSAVALDRDGLPVEFTAEGDRQPCVTVMEQRRGSGLWLILDGPEGGELVVPFDRIYYEDDRVVLVAVHAGNRRDHARKVFQGEHWGQWGPVSEWLEANGIDEIPRRFK